METTTNQGETGKGGVPVEGKVPVTAKKRKQTKTNKDRVPVTSNKM